MLDQQNVFITTIRSFVTLHLILHWNAHSPQQTAFWRFDVGYCLNLQNINFQEITIDFCCLCCWTQTDFFYLFMNFMWVEAHTTNKSLQFVFFDNVVVFFFVVFAFFLMLIKGSGSIKRLRKAHHQHNIIERIAIVLTKKDFWMKESFNTKLLGQ
jgi:hypothetical protein